jgi:hypothetical protein
MQEIICPKCGARYYYSSTTSKIIIYCRCGAYYENGVWYETSPVFYSDGRVELKPITENPNNSNSQKGRIKKEKIKCKWKFF